MPPMPLAMMGACPAESSWSTCTISMYQVSMPETVTCWCSRPELVRFAVSFAKACNLVCESTQSHAPASEDWPPVDSLQPESRPITVQVVLGNTREASYLGSRPSHTSHEGVSGIKEKIKPCCSAGIEDGKQEYVSPVHAKDLSGLPPALIFTAGKDMVMDEAEAYAARLAAAG